MSVSISFELLTQEDLPFVDRDPGSSPVAPGLTYAGSGSAYANSGTTLDFKAGLGSTLISSKMRQTLSTIAFGNSGKGEVPWRPEFGSSLPTLRFQNMQTSLPNVVSHYVREALERWVPEVKLVTVGVKADVGIGLLTVRVVYSEILSKKTVAATVEIQG